MAGNQLHRYWFQTNQRLGYGVTAYSEDDARNLIENVLGAAALDDELVRIIVDVDVRELDQGHVIPNMGPPNIRGVWYPMLNL
jgi:hypothetical protein